MTEGGRFIVNLAKNRFGGNADVALNVFLAYDQVTDLSAKPKEGQGSGTPAA
jgi:hypothetical protein